MKSLLAEILRRFPDVEDYIDEEDGPYQLMADLIFWLDSLEAEDFAPSLVDELAAFRDWCEAQPPGKDASEDLFTIWVVGFLETLFYFERTLKLAPKLVSREDFERNGEYLRRWIGAEKYAAALKLF